MRLVCTVHIQAAVLHGQPNIAKPPRFVAIKAVCAYGPSG